MAKLLWDQSGQRSYEDGIDRGVLYTPTAIAWNGLTGVDEGGPDAPEALYFDGQKYFDAQPSHDFAATLRAITYPDEFLEFEGVHDMGGGLGLSDQLPKTFGLSYRTRVGNDTDGDVGYKIHILYNLTAIPSMKSFVSNSDQLTPLEFSWDLGSIPEDISSEGYKPTAHVIIDSTELNRFLLRDLEGWLYGTDDADASLPTLTNLINMVDTWELITVVDNGDGTFTISGPDELVYPTGDGTSWQVDEIDAVYGTSSPYSTDTYTASTTYP